MRTISREELIKELCERMALSHGIPEYDTKKVISVYEELIKDCLKNVGGTDDLKIKIMDGIFVERHYVPEQKMKKGMLKDKTIKEHFNIKASVSKYFRDNLNKWFFDRWSRDREWYENDENKLFYFME